MTDLDEFRIVESIAGAAIGLAVAGILLSLFVAAVS